LELGLVLFDLNKLNPRFSIRMRAQRFSPDMSYVNEFAERMKLHDSELFQELFRLTGGGHNQHRHCSAEMRHG
jgi:hypothetical protein